VWLIRAGVTSWWLQSNSNASCVITTVGDDASGVPHEPEHGFLQQVQIDIVQRPDGAAFDPVDLMIPSGSMVIWTNRTSEAQAFQIGRRALTLAPHGHEGSVTLTSSRPHAAGQVIGQLQANPAAQITITRVPAEMH
jgi:hypothetical protein